MTGTPIQNSLNDLASLLWFVRAFPDLDMPKLRAICRRFAADDSVKEAFRSLCLRRSKAATSLPPRSDTVRLVRLHADESEEYKCANHDIIDLLSDAKRSQSSRTYPDVLVKINSLRQICNLGTGYHRLSSPTNPETPTSGHTVDPLLNELVSTGAASCMNCGTSIRGSPLLQSSEDNQENETALASPCGSFVCGDCFVALSATSGVTCNCSYFTSCGYTPICTAQNLDARYTEPINATKASSKVQSLVERINAIPQGEKALVFSCWTSTIDILERVLQSNGFKSVRLDGSMSPKQRQASLTTFKVDSSIRVLLISLRCGASGLNLTVANHVFLMEPQWNPMLEEQALSRVHRIGQTKPVHAVRFIVEGTIEENIRNLQATKKNLVEQVFGSRQKGSKWVERVEELTQESITG